MQLRRIVQILRWGMFAFFVVGWSTVQAETAQSEIARATESQTVIESKASASTAAQTIPTATTQKANDIEANPAFKPALWQVVLTEGNRQSTVYLFGTIHCGQSSFYPMPAAIEQAYNASDVLAVEADIRKADPSLMFSKGMLPASQSLKNVLSPDVYQALDRYAQANNIQMHAFERFQPWFIALQLVQNALMKSQCSVLQGVDMQLLNRGDKPVEEIESFEKQMAMFAGLSMDAQNAFLKQTLKDMQSDIDYFNALMTMWKEGDMAATEAMMLSTLIAMPKGDAFYKAIFVDRNVHMTDVIERYLQSGRMVFYTVGLAHYPGKDGILALLKKRGYTVERIH